MEPERFGQASVQYNDFTGTVAADDPHEHVVLYELAGIDREEWTIVGFKVSGGNELGGEGASWGSVLAVQTQPNDDGLVTWEQRAREHDGALPVTEFEIRGEHGTTGVRVLQELKRWSVHAVWGSLANQGIDLLVEEHVDAVEEQA